MTLSFSVRRREPELVTPALPTPCETKRLSDIDDQDWLRELVPTIFFYHGGLRNDEEPVSLIRQALSRALVPYYPLAGRLREVEGRKLVVDCTGEGVMFVEAEADVRLTELQAAGLRAPFPSMDHLLFDVEGSRFVLNCPLLLIQVTRLLCGGFILAVRHNHTICDATGLAEFISSVACLARGVPVPDAAAPWSRELLEARNPPTPGFPHREYDATLPTGPPPREMIPRTFTFGQANVAALKRSLPPHLRDQATTFEVLVASVWRARTAALGVPAGEDVRLLIVANFRRVRELGLPAGYYGNACLALAVVTTAGALLAGSLGDAVALVQEAKAALSAEYVRSTADLLVLRGRPDLAQANRFLVSDNRHAGFQGLDFGWGSPVYGGPANILFGASIVAAVKTAGGDDALAMPLVLPRRAMEQFASVVQLLLKV